MLRQGMWVRLIGEWGTPSQKTAIWVVDDRYPGPWVEIHRLGDPDARITMKAPLLEPTSALEMLGAQAEG